MKILILGGAGEMARMAISVLLESNLIEHITIGDLNADLAQTYVELVDSPKLSVIKVDIQEQKNLINLMYKNDLIINTVGPYFKFGITVLKAALKSQRNIIDICDDWKPTLEALKLHEEFQKAGLSAVIGFGASPGMTNILAKYTCSMFDTIHEIITAWGLCVKVKTGKKPKYYIKPKKLKKKIKKNRSNSEKNYFSKKENAAVTHLLYETLENIPTYRDGKMIEVKPLTEAERLAFPGFKEMYTCHIGHPEPITLSRTIKAQTISNVMYIGEKVTDILRSYSNRINNKEITINEASALLFDEYKKIERRIRMGRSPLGEYLGGPPSLTVVGKGVKNGIKKQLYLGLQIEPYGEMAGLTGVPLAIGAIMMLEGKISKKGVLTPEEAVNEPMRFFDRLAKLYDKDLSGKDILIIKES